MAGNYIRAISPMEQAEMVNECRETTERVGKDAKAASDEGVLDYNADIEEFIVATIVDIVAINVKDRSRFANF